MPVEEEGCGSVQPIDLLRTCNSHEILVDDDLVDDRMAESQATVMLDD